MPNIYRTKANIHRTEAEKKEQILRKLGLSIEDYPPEARTPSLIAHLAEQIRKLGLE